MQFLSQPVDDNGGHDVDWDNDGADIDVVAHQPLPQANHQVPHNCPKNDAAKKDIGKDPQAVTQREFA